MHAQLCDNGFTNGSNQHIELTHTACASLWGEGGIFVMHVDIWKVKFF
jgi:hypothetical protein